MKAVAVVAHPDDCVIFARPFMLTHPEYTWTIVYLTHTRTDIRCLEMQAYWAKQGIETLFLEFEDEWDSVVMGNLGFDADAAESAILKAIQEYDLVLTHGPWGEYGHPHHLFVHRVIKHTDKSKVYFASSELANIEYTLNTDVDLDQLPLHRNIIEQMPGRNTGRYYMVE